MDGTGEALGDQLTLDQMTKESPSEMISVFTPESSKDDEDLLNGLSPEEKECVEYLLQTINILEADVLEDDEDNTEKTAESLGAEDRAKSSKDSSIQPTLTSEGVLSKPCPRPSISTMKMIKSLSVESDDVTLRSRTDPYCLKAKGLQKSANSHHSHIRKFDTIMRSGVNVQELCSRYNLHCDNSALATREAREDIVGGAIKQVGKFPASQKSPRVEALQKLGLLHENSCLPNINQSVMTEVGQWAKAPLAEAVASSADSTEDE